jgi:hypothetical protein
MSSINVTYLVKLLASRQKLSVNVVGHAELRSVLWVKCLLKTPGSGDGAVVG